VASPGFGPDMSATPRQPAALTAELDIGSPRTVPQSSVHAGGKVTRGKFAVRSESNSGTAGFVVRKSDGSAGRFVLTCAHVLGGPSIAQGLAKDYEDAVYSPELSKCLIEWNSPIGKVVDTTLAPLAPMGAQIEQFISIGGATFGVDAALVELASDASADNVIPKIGPIAGVRDLITEWNLAPTGEVKFDPTRQLTVQKYGATTGYTSGKLTGLTPRKVAASDGSLIDAFVLEITADSGVSPTSADYELDIEAFQAQAQISNPQMVLDLFKGAAVTASLLGSDKTTLRVTGAQFSLPGDSGSPVLDNNKQLIGFLARGAVTNPPIYVVDQGAVDVYVGISYAILAPAALQYLKVEMLPNTQNASTAATISPGMPIRAQYSRPGVAMVEETLAAIATSEEGALIYAIVRPHYAEIHNLIVNNRQVAVSWHRARGAAFANALIRSSRSGDFTVPTVVDGTSLVDAVTQMRNVLLANGGESLRATIRDYDPWLLQLSRKGRVLHIHNVSGIPGTAGALVRDRRGNHYLLSNHHVVFGRNGREGHPIWATPAPTDHCSTAPVIVGHATGGTIGHSVCRGETYFVDCALVKLESPDRFPPWLRAALAGPWPTGAAAAIPDLQVIKHGPTTGTTTGAITDAAYPDSALIEQRTVRAPNQLLIRSIDPDLNFAAPGDSGAAVVDRRGLIVGVLWGSNAAGEGVACPIEPVLATLDVVLAPCHPDLQGELL